MGWGDMGKEAGGRRIPRGEATDSGGEAAKNEKPTPNAGMGAIVGW
jgi:hypothetical protein